MKSNNSPTLEFDSFLDESNKVKRVQKGRIYSIHLLKNEKPYGLSNLLKVMSPNLYLACDLHIGDPIDNWEAKRDKIVEVFNSTLKPKDNLLILGDLSAHTNTANIDDVKSFIDMLNCKNLYLILGNNDQEPMETYINMGFKTVTDKFTWKDYVFTHMPTPVFYNQFNFHGHIHEEIVYIEQDWHRHINVWDKEYKPIRISEAIERYNSGYYEGQTMSLDEYREYRKRKEFNEISNEQSTESSIVTERVVNGRKISTRFNFNTYIQKQAEMIGDATQNGLTSEDLIDKYGLVADKNRTDVVSIPSNSYDDSISHNPAIYDDKEMLKIIEADNVVELYNAYADLNIQRIINAFNMAKSAEKQSTEVPGKFFESIITPMDNMLITEMELLLQKNIFKNEDELRRYFISGYFDNTDDPETLRKTLKVRYNWNKKVTDLLKRMLHDNYLLLGFTEKEAQKMINDIEAGGSVKTKSVIDIYNALIKNPNLVNAYRECIDLRTLGGGVIYLSREEFDYDLSRDKPSDLIASAIMYGLRYDVVLFAHGYETESKTTWKSQSTTINGKMDTDDVEEVLDRIIAENPKAKTIMVLNCNPDHIELPEKYKKNKKVMIHISNNLTLADITMNQPIKESLNDVEYEYSNETFDKILEDTEINLKSFAESMGIDYNDNQALLESMQYLESDDIVLEGLVSNAWKTLVFFVKNIIKGLISLFKIVINFFKGIFKYIKFILASLVKKSPIGKKMSYIAMESADIMEFTPKDNKEIEKRLKKSCENMGREIQILSKRQTSIMEEIKKDTERKAKKYESVHESYVIETKRSELPTDIFGVPEERKYPLDSKEHVYSAIKLFNHVDSKYEKELAINISKKMKEYNITDVSPSDNNRFSKYYKKGEIMESIMNIVTETKKTVKVMSEEEVRKCAIKLSETTDDSNLKSLATEILNGLETSFESVNRLIGTISNVILLGLFAIPSVLELCIGVIACLVVTLPLQLIKGILTSQIRFLKGRTKPDENTKMYYTAVNQIIKCDSIEQISIESFLPVLEAPTKVTAEDGGEKPNDRTEEVEPVVEEPAEDDTEDNKPDNNDDTDNQDDNNDDTENDQSDTQDDEQIDEEPNDYTDDVGTDDDTDTGEDGDTTDTDTSDDMSENSGEEDTKIENNNIKNYNLLLDFQTLHKSIEGILQHLKTINYPTSIQNSVLTRCYDNINDLNQEVIDYITLNYVDDYTVNLYYYNIYLQALRINYELLSKVTSLGADNKN